MQYKKMRKPAKHLHKPVPHELSSLTPSIPNSALLSLLQHQGEDVLSGQLNKTGLPDAIKARFERMSGMTLDDVRVHYNSNKPAQLGAAAYTQGNEVYIGPGNEHSLEHELVHVVQQKQGIVQPTFRFGNQQINYSKKLEHEAKNQIFHTPDSAGSNVSRTIQCDWDTFAQPRTGISSFEKPISQQSDTMLAKRFEDIRGNYLESGKQIFLYLAVGTANASANGTNPSSPTRAKPEYLQQQQNPSITGDALKEGYQVITVNIDAFGSDKEDVSEDGNRVDIVINGVFPVSGKVDTGEDSKAIPAMKSLIDSVIGGNGQVIFLNAIEDSPSEEEPNSFRLFSGMRSLIPARQKGVKNFTYATSYLEQQPGFNLYKGPLPRQGFLVSKNKQLASMNEILLSD